MNDSAKEIDEKMVKNPDALAKFKALVKSPLLNEKAMYEASNGEIINIAWLKHHLDSKIAALPSAEQEKILVMKTTYHKLLLKASVLRKQAMGVDMGMPRGADHPLLLQPKEEELIELFGRMFSPEEVHKIVVEDFKLPASLQQVINFRRKHLNTITEKIELFKREYSDIRLGVKRSRLEELVWMYNRLKSKYKETDSREDVRVMLSLIEQVRKEVEGDTIKFEGNLDVNLESTVNIHLQKEVFHQLNINQIIMGRVASRMGQQSIDLVRALQDSYYSRFNKMNGIDDVDYEEIEYPSNVPYDFDQIKTLNGKDELALDERNAKRKVDKEAKMEQAAVLGFKEKLLAKLANKQEEVKNKVIDVEASTLKTKVARLEEQSKSEENG